MESFEKALGKAKAQKGKPSIIQLRTHIGFGSPNFQDTHTAHGAPLGDDEIKLIKKNFGWDPEKEFNVPDEALGHMRKALDRGKKLQKDYDDMFAKYAKAHPRLAGELTDLRAGKFPVNLDDIMPKFEAGS